MIFCTRKFYRLVKKDLQTHTPTSPKQNIFFRVVHLINTPPTISSPQNKHYTQLDDTTRPDALKVFPATSLPRSIYSLALRDLVTPGRLDPDDPLDVAGKHRWHEPVLDRDRVQQVLLVEHVRGRHVLRDAHVRMGIEVDDLVAPDGEVARPETPVQER